MKDKPILCLDFDGVIHSYTSGWKGATVIPDPPVLGAIDFIREAAASFRVAIYSSRSKDPEARKAMMLWLIANGLPEVAFDGVDQAVYLEEFHVDFVKEDWHHAVYFPTEKPPAFVTLDDRAITFTGVWPEIADLRAFKPWNKMTYPSGAPMYAPDGTMLDEQGKRSIFDDVDQ